MNKEFGQKWWLAMGAIAGVVGSLLGQVITYFIKDEFSLSIVLGAFTGATLLVIINLVMIRNKKDKTPDVDERIKANMLKYYTVVGQAFIGLSFLALGVLMFLEVGAISTTYLFIVFVAYLWISGIGALVVKYR